MERNQSGLILCGFRPLASGVKSQKSRLRSIAARGCFGLLAAYATMYSRGDCTPPAPFPWHLPCKQLWTHFVPFPPPLVVRLFSSFDTSLTLFLYCLESNESRVMRRASLCEASIAYLCRLVKPIPKPLQLPLTCANGHVLSRDTLYLPIPRVLARWL